MDIDEFIKKNDISLKVEFFENHSWKMERLVSPTRKHRDFSVQKYGKTFWSYTLFYIFLNSKLGLNNVINPPACKSWGIFLADGEAPEVRSWDGAYEGWGIF